MGEHLRSEAADDELLEDNHPSCIGGIFHALDYHSWHYNVKKMLLLPYKKQHGPRKAKGNGRSKIRMNVHDSDEVQNLLDAKADNFLIDPRNTKTSSTNKRSLKARIKALISEEISKEKSCMQRGSGIPAPSCLRRTYSIHQSESLDHGSQRKITGLSHQSYSLHSNADRKNAATKFDDEGHMKSAKEANAFNEKFTGNVVDYMKHKKLSEMCEKAKENSANQKPTEAKEQSGKASQYQCKDYTDTLEIFRVNRDSFLKILQDTDDGIANHFFNIKASDSRTRLSKSGSFPSADFSRTRNFSPSKLEDKQNEVWSFPKGEKFFADAQAPKLVASKFPKDLYTKSDLVMADDAVGAVGNQDEYSSPTDSTHGLDKQGSNKVLVDPVYEINNTTEYALGEHNDKPRSCFEIDGSAYDLSKRTPTHRRTFSANESLERYAQLFHSSFGKEAKLHHSKSLKLKNEYEIPSGGHASTFFKRVHSLSHLNSHCSLQSKPSCDAQLSGTPIRTVVDSSKNVENGCQDEPKPVNLFIPNEETESPHHVVENSCLQEHLARLTESTNECATADMLGLGEEMDRQINEEIDSDKEHGITLSEIANNKLPQPSTGSIVRSCFQEDLNNSADFPVSEGLAGRDNYVDEKESLLDSQCKSCSDTLSEKFEIANKSDKNNCHVELRANEDADFNYVSNILERSGFVENGFLGPLYSLDQPLNPSAFEEVEACWPHDHEPQCPGKEIHPCCQRRLLFDLTNEVLLQIYDSSFTYYPRALSSNCRVHPVPVKHNVVEEVWARMSKTLRPGWEDPSVDCVVAHDLGKDDGWMNLQTDTECVALELEDVIFNELLEEIFCS